MQGELQLDTAREGGLVESLGWQQMVSKGKWCWWAGGILGAVCADGLRSGQHHHSHFNPE